MRGPRKKAGGVKCAAADCDAMAYEPNSYCSKRHGWKNKEARARAGGDEASNAPQDDDETGGGTVYDLVIKVPAAQIAVLFAAFSTDEQAYAVQSVLQMRTEAGA